MTSGMAAASSGITPEQMKENLAKIPPSDPVVANPPKLLDSIAGKHPRLLFTAKEIEALKARIPSDPILKKTYEDLSARSKKFKLRPEIAEKLVADDTPALATGNGLYPELAYAYALDHDPAVKQSIIDILNMMLKEEHWGATKELDSSMGAACNMMMMAVLYDAVYNDLEPEFRTQLANKLLTHAKRLFYLGHKQLAVNTPKYWQQDPQPNHRWYRARGLAASMLAIADEKGLETGYLMEELKKEMDFLTKWYPPDGDCHEGAGYQTFGFRSLLETARMMDRNLGTKYLDNTGFKNAWMQQVYYWLPGKGKTISFGDAQNAPVQYMYDCPPFLIGPSLSRDKNAQAALLNMFRQGSKGKDGQLVYPWTLLEFYDPSVGEGNYKALNPCHLFADLGAASMRDNWDDQAVVLTFKCGPYGGYRLNEYRHAVPDADGKPHYVNVAHDDPDANSIAMSIAGDFLFHPGVYSTKKMTDTISSITVDGKGQVMEGDSYTQPLPERDMRKLSYLTGWKTGDKGRVIVEGEAGNAYSYYGHPPETREAVVKAPTAAPEPPKPNIFTDSTLKKFRRSTLWMPGEYILVLDDIVADGPRIIMWRGTVEKASFIDPAEGKCRITTEGGKQVNMQMLSNKPIQGAIDHCFLAGRWGNELIQQLQFPVKSDAVKYVCLLDPWNKNATMIFKDSGDTATITVKGEGFEDTWTWKQSKDNTAPSLIEGKRNGGPLIALTEQDKAPHGD